VLQDSDDEVLVPLEDVLIPHPEDFLDAQALGLTSQVRHATWVDAARRLSSLQAFVSFASCRM
jgi:hypothetical protein